MARFDGARKIALNGQRLGIGGTRVITQLVDVLSLDDVRGKRLAGVEIDHLRIRRDVASLAYEAMHGFLAHFIHVKVVRDPELVRFRRQQPVADLTILLSAVKLPEREKRTQEKQRSHFTLRAVIFTGN